MVVLAMSDHSMDRAVTAVIGIGLFVLFLSAIFGGGDDE